MDPDSRFLARGTQRSGVKALNLSFSLELSRVAVRRWWRMNLMVLEFRDERVASAAQRARFLGAYLIDVAIGLAMEAGRRATEVYLVSW